jgi:hypothetical protein
VASTLILTVHIVIIKSQGVQNIRAGCLPALTSDDPPPVYSKLGKHACCALTTLCVDASTRWHPHMWNAAKKGLPRNGRGSSHNSMTRWHRTPARPLSQSRCPRVYLAYDHIYTKPKRFCKFQQSVRKVEVMQDRSNVVGDVPSGLSRSCAESGPKEVGVMHCSAV